MNDVSLTFQWLPEYEVGNTLIDSQHKALFSLGNELHKVILHNKKYKPREFRDLLITTLENLGQYVFFHFKSEENLMKKYNYPNIDEHILNHQELFSKLNKVKDSLSTLSNDQLSKVLLEQISFWLLTHIKEKDVGFVQYIKAKEKMKKTGTLL